MSVVKENWLSASDFSWYGTRLCGCGQCPSNITRDVVPRLVVISMGGVIGLDCSNS
jgi:hypothetical protein